MESGSYQTVNPQVPGSSPGREPISIGVSALLGSCFKVRFCGALRKNLRNMSLGWRDDLPWSDIMLGHFDGRMSYLTFRFHQAVAVRFLRSRLCAQIPKLKSL